MINRKSIIRKTSNEAVKQAAKNLGYSDLQARIISQRTDSIDDLVQVLQPKLQHIQHPKMLKNSAEAAKLIADAISSDGLIVLSTDYDVDGVTSLWVAYQALVNHFGVDPQRVKPIISERKDGYGINDAACEQILQLNQTQPVALVISSDQGTSDEPRIAKLAAAGIDVCVTDHHKIPAEGAPKSAACLVNPQQDGCEYDKNIAGCFVVFLVMSQVRQELLRRGVLPADAPSLKDLTINLALGTVADSVSLLSPNNRAVVAAGLGLINQFDNPAWQAFRSLNNNQNEPFNAEFLGFQVATRINAASRVGDVKVAFDFLNAAQPDLARQFLNVLEINNEERKNQQQAMLEQALALAESKNPASRYSLALKIDGNPGIQGIIATRVGEQFGLPCVALTQIDEQSLAGSGRAIVNGLDLSQAFAWINQQQPDLFVSHGGHKGAAGCQIKIEYLAEFEELLETAVKLQLGEQAPTPTIESDGEIDIYQLTPDLISQLAQLEPYGREWPKPVFDGRFQVQDLRIIGKTKNHLSLKLWHQQGGKPLNAVFFNALNLSQQQVENPDLVNLEDVFYQLGVQVGDWVEAVYQPSLNTFQGRSSVQLRIQYLQKV